MVSFSPQPAASAQSSASHIPEPGFSSPRNAASAEIRPLDILFLQDATGSQGPYIKSARSAIQDICVKISANTSLSKGSIRFGLIAFRDHPPQDMSYVTKNFGFTSDTARMKKNLDSLIASGGGDGPEAQTAALAEALNMEWAENAVKIVVLITDAPPHGIGEGGDGFLESPDQNDPLDIVRQMAERGITLYVIACEPTLSRSYRHAVDFYRAICQITSGRMVPLLNASQLGEYIVGSAVETIETEKLIGEFQHVILEDVYGQGKPIEEVMQNIQQEMTANNVQINTFHVEDVYAPSEAADYNTSVWTQARSVGSARGLTKPIASSRLKAGFATTASSSPPVDRGTWEIVKSSRKGSPRPPLGAAPPPALRRSPPVSPMARHLVQMQESEDDVEEDWSAVGVPRGKAIERARSRPLYQPPAPRGSAPAWHGAVVAGSTRGPAVSMAPQAIQQSQTNRIVMQSLMRRAKVGPGNVLTPTGKYAIKTPAASTS